MLFQSAANIYLSNKYDFFAVIALRHFLGSISWKRENALLRFGQSDNP